MPEEKTAQPPLMSWSACEWNPKERRACFADELHAVASISLGNGKWHLCADCAALPEFKRFRKRNVIIWRRTPQPAPAAQSEE